MNEREAGVLRWLQQRGQSHAGLRLSTALWRFWFMRGYLSEGAERERLFKVEEGVM